MDNDHRLDEVQSLARGLRQDRDEIGASRDELTDSLAELHREPRATVELTEAELRYLLDFDAKGFEGYHDIHSSFGKLRQALVIETQPGGKFCDPA